MALILPEVLNDFNLYGDGEKMIGQTGEVTLPDFTMITDTLQGSGVMGEIEDPVTGQFESATMSFTWACLHENYFKLVNTTRPVTLTLRGALQCIDSETAYTDYYPVKILVRGKAKTVNLGKAEKGKKMECETEIEVIYIKVEVDAKTLFELDKLNGVYILNGEDMLKKIRQYV